MKKPTQFNARCFFFKVGMVLALATHFSFGATLQSPRPFIFLAFPSQAISKEWTQKHLEKKKFQLHHHFSFGHLSQWQVLSASPASSTCAKLPLQKGMRCFENHALLPQASPRHRRGEGKVGGSSQFFRPPTQSGLSSKEATPLASSSMDWAYAQSGLEMGPLSKTPSPSAPLLRVGLIDESFDPTLFRKYLSQDLIASSSKASVLKPSPHLHGNQMAARVLGLQTNVPLSTQHIQVSHLLEVQDHATFFRAIEHVLETPNRSPHLLYYGLEASEAVMWGLSQLPAQTSVVLAAGNGGPHQAQKPFSQNVVIQVGGTTAQGWVLPESQPGSSIWIGAPGAFVPPFSSTPQVGTSLSAALTSYALLRFQQESGLALNPIEAKVVLAQTANTLHFQDHKKQVHGVGSLNYAKLQAVALRLGREAALLKSDPGLKQKLLGGKKRVWDAGKPPATLYDFGHKAQLMWSQSNKEWKDALRLDRPLLAQSAHQKMREAFLLAAPSVSHPQKTPNFLRLARQLELISKNKKDHESEIYFRLAQEGAEKKIMAQMLLENHDSWMEKVLLKNLSLLSHRRIHLGKAHYSKLLKIAQGSPSQGKEVLDVMANQRESLDYLQALSSLSERFDSLKPQVHRTLGQLARLFPDAHAKIKPYLK